MFQQYQPCCLRCHVHMAQHIVIWLMFPLWNAWKVSMSLRHLKPWGRSFLLVQPRWKARIPFQVFTSPADSVWCAFWESTHWAKRGALHGRKDGLHGVVQVDTAASVAPKEDRCPQLRTSGLMCHNVSAQGHSAALLQQGVLGPAPCYWIPANSTVLMEMADRSVYPLWAQSKSN